LDDIAPVSPGGNRNYLQKKEREKGRKPQRKIGAFVGYQYILFDLDGTLLNSQVGLGKSATYSLEQIGLGHLVTRRLLDSFLGVPLRQGYLEFCGMDTDQCERAVDLFEQYYLSKGIYESTLFLGIDRMLRGLHQAGKVLGVATNGMGANARLILKHFGVAGYFSAICGLTSLGAAESKPDVIRRTLKELDVQDPRQAVMVGDRYFDIEAAKSCGLSAIGILYGYGSREEIASAGADRIVESVDTLQEILLG
jgi:phosphoglycolate phosphatase